MQAKNEPTKIGRFDQVRLLTTRNVHYLSAPGDLEAKPGGIWSVAGAVGGELLVVKNNVTIRIPVTDVLKIADYSLDKITNKLGRLSRGKGDEERGTTKGPGRT